MQLIADLHTHTLASGHTYCTLRENAKAAAEAGLKILGTTEHAPGIPGTCDPVHFVNFKVIPRELYGVKQLFGSEINVLNDGTLSLGEKYISKLDYAIAGIHGLCYTDAGREQNTDNLISCMRHEKVKFVSHPDDDHTPLNYERLVKAAKEYQVALEVNNSSLIKKEDRWNCYENYRVMLHYCQLYQVPIVINSDAHDPFYVGEFRRAEAYVKELDFPEELILNTDTEKIAEFLGVDLSRSLPDMGF